MKIAPDIVFDTLSEKFNSFFIPQNVRVVVTKNITAAEPEFKVFLKNILEKHFVEISGLSNKFYLDSQGVYHSNDTHLEMTWHERTNRMIENAFRHLVSFTQNEECRDNEFLDVMFFETDASGKKVVSAWHAVNLRLSRLSTDDSGYSNEVKDEKVTVAVQFTADWYRDIELAQQILDSQNL